MTDKFPKLTMLKSRITTKSHKLNLKWTLDNLNYEVPRKKPETQEEEAEEIIRRLQAPPRSRGWFLEGEIMDVLSKSIAEEIDREIIENAKTSSRT